MIQVYFIHSITSLSLHFFILITEKETNTYLFWIPFDRVDDGCVECRALISCCISGGLLKLPSNQWIINASSSIYCPWSAFILLLLCIKLSCQNYVMIIVQFCQESQLFATLQFIPSFLFIYNLTNIILNYFTML